MTLNELVEVQRAFDIEHGWVADSHKMGPLLSMARRDLIGVIGELGEFSNVVKKLGLAFDRRGDAPARRLYVKFKSHLADELVDTLIYLVRLASLLDVDLEKEYRKKMSRNALRYRRYRVHQITRRAVR